MSMQFQFRALTEEFSKKQQSLEQCIMRQMQRNNSEQQPHHNQHHQCVVRHGQSLTSHREPQSVSLLPASPSHVCTHSLLPARQLTNNPTPIHIFYGLLLE